MKNQRKKVIVNYNRRQGDITINYGGKKDLRLSFQSANDCLTPKIP